MFAGVKEEDEDFVVMTINAVKADRARSPYEGSRVFRGVFMPVNGPFSSDGKTALVYDDPFTGRSFRFILHRKNARKADIYACAKCKSRRKYVRIMVHNDTFLCDPASLDHICYMNAIELQDERVRVERRKHWNLKRLASEVTHYDETLLEGGIGSLCYKRSLTSESPSPSPKSPMGAEESTQMLSLNEFISQTDPVAEVNSSNDVTRVGTSRESTSHCKEEPQMSEQEPTEAKATPLRDEVCLESIKMALENLPKNCRDRAYVDILRYVYTTIFDKYLCGDSLKDEKES